MFVSPSLWSLSPRSPVLIGLFRRAVQRRLCRSSALFSALVGLGLLWGCAPAKSVLRPQLQPEQQAVVVYYPGETLCEPRIDLGFVQGIAGQEPLPGQKAREPATLEAALDFLRLAAWEHGANAVLLLDRKQSSSEAVYVTTGTAIRCQLPDTSPIDP